MKVLVVSTLYPPNGRGGAEITAHILARCLIMGGHEVASVSLLPPGGVARTQTVDSVLCHYVPLANVYWQFGPRPRPLRPVWQGIDAHNPIMGARVGRVMDRERPDVVHMHNLQGFSVSAWRAARRRGLPVVQTLHDYYLACPRSVMFRDGRNCDRQCPDCRLFRLPALALSGTPAAVTGVSRRQLDRITATGLFAEVPRRAVIRGCNEPGAAADPGAVRRRRATTPPTGAALRVGYIGRLDPMKGIEVLIRAAELLPVAEFDVAIAGEGQADYAAALRAGTARSNIRFVGYVENPAEFYEGVDVVVVPSVWEEPAGRVIHEAYAHGVPVIASRLGGPAEMVIEGRTGYLFEPGNARALADVLARARRSGVGSGALFEACREESTRYTAERIAGEYTAVLEEAAAARGKGSGQRTARGGAAAGSWAAW